MTMLLDLSTPTPEQLVERKRQCGTRTNTGTCYEQLYLMNASIQCTISCVITIIILARAK